MRRRWARVAASLVSAATLGAAVAFAGPDDFTPGSVRAEIEAAVRADAPSNAVAALDRLLDEATPRIRARHVEAAKAAMELLPPDVGGGRAARFLAEALRLDPSQAGGAWAAAQDLRKDLLRRVAVEDGIRFLAHLIEIYPAVPQYRHDLAVLLLDGGRRDEARVQLELNFRMAPSDTWAGYTLALIAEEDGDTAGAVAIYDRLSHARPNEMRARLLKVRLLAQSDRPAARASLDESVRAAEAASTEAVRADFLEQCAAEREGLDVADSRRAAVATIEGRVQRVLWSSVAAWVVVLLVLLRWTRSAPAGTGRISPRN
ncbi:MAG: hypothetical protein K8T90_06915 [Planctomycetes bacterium]|nr:hypothetical protein [Planctomycetota bacterium]